MIDIQLIRDNQERVAQKAKEKGYEVDVEYILGFDKERKELLAEVEELRQQRNKLAAESKGQKPTEKILGRGRQIKDKLLEKEHQLVAIELSLEKYLKKVPNMPTDDVPVGASEDENQVVKEVGQNQSLILNQKITPKLLKTGAGWTAARAAKVAASRFVYLKGDLVNLQFAIVRFVMDTLGDQEVIKKILADNKLDLNPKTFVPVIPPALIKTDIYEASG